MKNSMKKGFSLIAAVIFIVVIATLGMLALSFSTKSAKQSTDVYLKEQAEILARSATEFTVMAMQKHDYTNNCLENITIYYPSRANPLYTIFVRLFYFDTNLANCNSFIPNANLPASHPSSHTALIDVRVESNQGAEPVVYTLQSIQKP